MHLLRTIFSFFLLFGTVLAFSQSTTLVMKSDSVIVASNGEMRSVMVQIQNNADSAQQLVLASEAGVGIRLLNPRTTIEIEAKEKLFVPFKIFVEKVHSAGSSIVRLQLQDASEKIVAKQDILLNVEPKRQLRISANEPQVLIYRVGDSLKISTQVTNAGNQTEDTEIFATFPQNLGSETILKKKVTLPAFTSQKVEFSRIIDRDLLRMEVFTVNIAGINSNKEFFGNTMVMVQNALGNRRYIDPLTNNYRHNTGNHISWTTSNPFEQYSASHSIDLRAQINFGNTNATFNINGTYWPKVSTEMLFQNTWLKLENRNFGLQLGHLHSTDLEISLNGRGAQMSYIIGADDKTMITTGFVEKSFNIFDPLRFNNFPRGYSAFTKSQHNIDQYRKIDAEVVLDSDPYQKGAIVKGGYAFNNFKDKAYEIDLGLGQARSTTDVRSAESSVSLGFNYRKNWDKFSFSSTNYYSSGYYPGIRHGSTVTEQRLTKSFKNFSMFGGYSLHIYNPKNVGSLYYFNLNSKRHRVEVGSNFTIAKKVGVNFVSQLSTEQSDIFLGATYSRVPVQFNSASVSAVLNYSTADNKSRFSLGHAQGFSHYLDITEPQHIYSFQASWHHANFMLSANYQQGNFLLYEGNRNGILNSDSEKFSAMATYQISMLNNKFNLNVAALANTDTQMGNSYSLSANAGYKLFRTTKILGTYNYSRYARNGFETGNTYYQMGVSQDLPSVGDEVVKYKNGAIKVFSFYDLNNNNTYEPGIDKIAKGVKIKINHTVFISDESGNIRYRKLPYGEYSISPIENEWYGETRKVDLQQKELFITMPLEKTGVLRGKVSYEQTTKFQYEVQEHLAGIPIHFQNTFGKTFTFYTNAQGQYTAYIPVGKYSVTLESKVLQKNVYTETSFESVIINEGASSLADIILRVREKKVEIKKFGTTE